MAGRGERFLINVLWSWLGVAATLFVGFFLSPYIIHKLGAERFGIWALVFSIIDYFWFFDLGLNTALTNFCARYLATGERAKINELVNTAFFYFSCMAVFLMGLTVLLARNVERFFHVSPAFQKDFSTLIMLTGLSWGLCIALHMFVSCLDGFQRFDLTGRVSVLQIVLRSCGSAVLLMLGYGLVEMGIVYVSAQMLAYVLNFFNFRRVYPELRFSYALVRRRMFREIFRYGLHSFLASGSTLMLNQSGPVLIGHFLPAAFVGYYALPSRLLQYGVDAVSRIGMVTRSSAAELGAAGHRASVLRLGIYSNRYSLTLFMPVVLVLLTYGRELIAVWVGAEFATYSAPLLAVLSLSTAFVMAGQFNSSSILFGLGKHDGYARALMMEAVANVAGLAVVIPRFGILGAAWVVSMLMVISRGIVTPWLVCRSLQTSFAGYMASIYVRPVLTAVPILALAWLMKTRGIGGRNWRELLAVSVAIGLGYIGVAFVTCIEREHRGMFLARIPWMGARVSAMLH